MKYVIIDQIKNGDQFTTEFDTLQDAIEQAEIQFNHLTEYDKRRRSGFYILKSIDPDENSERHFDGEPVKIYI